MTRDYESLGIFLLVAPVVGSRVPCLVPVPTNGMFPNWVQQCPRVSVTTVDSVYHFKNKTNLVFFFLITILFPSLGNLRSADVA